MKRSEKGFSIVEAIIAGALLAVGGLAIDYYFVQGAKSTLKVRGYSSRDKIVDTVRQAAGMAVSLRNSFLVPDNPQFDACVTVNPSFLVADPTKRDCTSGATSNFTLIGPFVTDTAGGPTYTGAVAGPSKAKPVYYDLTGRSCGTLASPECLIIAWSEFTPQCPSQSSMVQAPAGSKCDVAETVKVSYHVAPLPSPPPNFEVPVFEQVDGSVTVSVKQISGASSTSDTIWPTPTPWPTGMPTPTPVPHPHVHCPGQTHQYGYTCNCPYGQVLIDYVNAICADWGI